MHIGNVSGLIALVAVPVILLVYAYRRRLPVRQVAGVFLWGAPTAASHAARPSRSLRPTATLVRDLIAALLLAVLAADFRTTGDSADPADPERGLDVVVRLVLCVAAAALLAASWRRNRISAE